MQFTGDPSLVIGAMQGGGLSGTTVASIGSAVGLGLLSSLNGAFQYQGVSVGVGQGTDVSLIIGTNVATLTSTLQATHAALCAGFGGGSGSATPALYSALAAGIAAMLATGVTVPGTGIVTPAGPLGPASSVGTSLSFVI
jgi:hypothetical protein